MPDRYEKEREALIASGMSREEAQRFKEPKPPTPLAGTPKPGSKKTGGK